LPPGERSNFTKEDYERLEEYNNQLTPDSISESDNELATDWNLVDDDESEVGTERSKKYKLSPYHLMLCRSKLAGYCLQTKEWLEFFVHCVTNVSWNEQAFESLVLPGDHKDMLLAFSQSQIRNRASFDDVIKGKGSGIIMLLSGSPGIGKTLTAEALAEQMHRPLYSITPGDLGSTVEKIEFELRRNLTLVSRWNAILLIDECDVLLEARCTKEIVRNQIVSIFLRTLEYYTGIMFMTTNRVDNIDPAFQSRIHISLAYPDLTDESRRQIWNNFLVKTVKDHELSAQDIEDLSKVQLNGRIIKNIIKTAQLLALSKNAKLNRSHIEVVFRIQKNRPQMSGQLL
jgi:SpoVK/Ycf46/Vps4 family AAA+-type ATPase